MAVVRCYVRSFGWLSAFIYFNFCVCSSELVYHGNLFDLRYVRSGDANGVDGGIRSVCVRRRFNAGCGVCARVTRFIRSYDSIDFYAFSSNFFIVVLLSL